MWINSETGSNISARKLLVNGFSLQNAAPKPLHDSDFLSFLISQREFESIAKLEALADEKNDDLISETMEKIVKKWMI